MPGRSWYLETAVGGRLHRFPIATFPFRVGRQLGLELVLAGESVSKLHAEIYEAWPGLRVRDLGSLNGTFLNRSLVQDAPLGDGDVLHFAELEFRLGRSEPAADGSLAARRVATVKTATLPHASERRSAALRQLLREGRVTVALQPIVALSTRRIAGYEALGRGRHPELPEQPRELFRIAGTIGAEAELSRLFRRKAVELAGRRANVPALFLNTHPAEFAPPGLVESLDEVRALAPRLDLALEIHESVLTQPSAIAELRATLAERNIALVFDNFGAGRARLHELTEAPPDYLKFHRKFVEGLDTASPGKRRLLRSLLSLAEQLGTKTVAEGVETEAEAKACAGIGFGYGQGAHLGEPRTIEQA